MQIQIDVSRHPDDTDDLSTADIDFLVALWWFVADSTEFTGSPAQGPSFRFHDIVPTGALKTLQDRLGGPCECERCDVCGGTVDAGTP